MRLAWRACSNAASVAADGAFPAAISCQSLTLCETKAAATALTWISELQSKKLVEPPEGVEAEITTKAGRLQYHKE